ncbi:MAG: hypothetical protein JJ920_15085 [Roseitalea sp.]|jgi:hypothetical protein|nr:hypothetical protein [Roseitalea sp.]MBO6721179.1 hypothetical protein [Roseitalea sp.]MBO6744237.1 hypothetical protein [Roseitalea sp.]
MIVVLALVTAMTVHGGQNTGQASAAGHVHAEMATETIADMLADCCDVADGQIHHTMSGCALADMAPVPLIAVERDTTEAGLRFARSRAMPDSPLDTPIRPPIAA